MVSGNTIFRVNPLQIICCIRIHHISQDDVFQKRSCYLLESHKCSVTKNKLGLCV